MSARSHRLTARNGRIPRRRLILVLAVTVLGTTGWAQVVSEGARQGAVVVAEFASASPLLTGSDVKVDGVRVGAVSDIRVSEKNTALVSMKLEPEAFPLHRDASASIRAVSLLGERYLDLERGTPSSPGLPSGAKLGLDRTRQNTDLDQVLNTVDQPTGEALAQLVVALGEGMDGNGRNVADAIAALAPAMKDTGRFTALVREQNTLLNSLVDRLEPVASALGANRGKALDGLVGSARTLTAATARRHRELESTLSQLPATLTEARSVLGDLAGAARETTPTLRSLRPVTDDLQTISRELRRFSDALDPALAGAEPVLDRAKELLDQARPVADQLRKAGPQLRSVAGSARPVVTDLAANFGDVLKFLRYWALTTNGYDGISHYFRAHVTFDASIFANHVLPQALGPDAPKVPPLNHPPDSESLLPPGLLAPADSPDGSATGLDEQQESNILGFLLGGGS